MTWTEPSPTAETIYAQKGNVVSPLSSIDLSHLPPAAREQALEQAKAQLAAEQERA